MLRSILVCTLLALVTGCATEPAPPPAACKTDKLDWAIGKQADTATVREVYIRSGTGLWRIVMPGQAVKEDYRPDRLSIHVDAKNTITGFSCG